MALDPNQSKILQRLQRSTLGLSSREIARSVKQPPHLVTKVLLELQRTGLAERKGGRWKAVHGTTSVTTSGSLQSATRARQQPLDSLINSTNERRGSNPAVSRAATVAEPDREIIDPRHSRWGMFRKLCKYYAECIRLDQKATIHAKSSEEYKKIVCIGGALSSLDSFNIETLSSWHDWLKNLQKEEFVFLGYPLNRYEWKDSKTGDRIEYISPVFIQPYIYDVQGTTLQLKAAGSIRINEGWLERRMPKIEERRAFVELCGISENQEADADLDRFENREPWVEYARLLQHYYPNWCIEPLNPRQLSVSPTLDQISKDGIYNRAALVLSRALKYTRRLYNELLELGSFVSDERLDGTALNRLFPNQPYKTDISTSKKHENNKRNIQLIGAQAPSLNHEQRQACEAAARKALSIVVGPPGTGKSRVVAATLAQQAIIGSDALFASRNHRALEAVVPRVSALTEPFSLILRLNRPWGDPVDHSLELAIQELVFSPPPRHESNLSDLRARLAKRILRFKEASSQILAIADARRELRKAMNALDDAKLDIPDSIAEHFTFQKATPRQSDLATVINELRPKQSFSLSLDWFFDLFNYNKRISNAIAKAIKLDQEMRRAFDKGKSLPQSPTTVPSKNLAPFYQQALSYWTPVLKANELAGSVFQSRTRLDQLPTLQTAYEQELECSNTVVKLSHETLVELSNMAGGSLTDEERTLLASVNAAIQNQSGLDSEEDKRRLANAMRKTFPIFLNHFPLAATTNLSVGSNMPLEPMLYDLLIIDEASQCDIASVIPLLFRAKRAMIVGDPMQLTHVTTLSAATDRHLRKQFGLAEMEFERFSYRTTSMFNLANTSPSVESRTSLRQHHRCHPAIADYCSETFYKGGWTVLTQHDPLGGLRWTQVDDDCQSAAGGGSISKNQIASIVNELERLSNDGFVGSIGVVTPFRQQANRVRDAVGQAIAPHKLKAWRFHVDTADGFQGDERDIVLFSLVGGADLKPGSLRFLSNSPNRFNVAASRAQKLLHVFGDMEWASKSGIRHIQILADRCRNAESDRRDKHQAPFRSDLVGPVWEPRLAAALTAASIPFQQQYPACGKFLDFAVIKPGLKLNIEVDGETYHRDEFGNRLAEDILRDQVLVADGWTILRFWVYQLKEDMPNCIEEIKGIWESRANKKP